MVTHLNPMSLADAESLLAEIGWRPDMSPEESARAAGDRPREVSTAINVWITARRAELNPLKSLLADMEDGTIPKN